MEERNGEVRQKKNREASNLRDQWMLVGLPLWSTRDASGNWNGRAHSMTTESHRGLQWVAPADWALWLILRRDPSNQLGT